MHGPEHHVLDGVALLVAFYNAGGKLEIKDAYDYGEVVSSCRYGIEKCYINLEVNIPISGIKNFISLIDSLGELGYKSIRLAPRDSIRTK